MTNEGKKIATRLPTRARLVAAATALVSAVALSAPAVAGASCGPRSPNGFTITQNTAMIVDVSGSGSTTSAAVSWGDVSWSDVL
jgi:hypothetical protein